MDRAKGAFWELERRRAGRYTGRDRPLGTAPRQPEAIVNRWLARCAPATAMAIAITMIVPSGASGATTVASFALEGGGTIAPGLTTTPTSQTSVSFGGQLAGFHSSDGSFAGEASCLFQGSSTIAETVGAGKGNGTADCVGNGVDARTVGGTTAVVGVAWITIHSNGLEYTRTSSVVVISGTAVVTVTDGVGSTSANTFLNMACLFEPLSVDPTVAYVLQCAGESGISIF
jgi:hypothetical protein